MADTAAFGWLCNELERVTTLNRLEARGTVRIALKQAGLESRSVTPDQMRVVVEKLLPGELETRGVDGASEMRDAMLVGLETLAEEPAQSGSGTDTPDEVFRRLGGG